MRRGPGVADRSDLERGLRDLGDRLDYPSAPGLARAVAQRLRVEPAPLRERRRRWRKVAVLAAAAVLLIGGAAVAARFVLRGVEIVDVPTPPPASPAPPGEGLALGRAVTPAEAEDSVSYPLRRPTALPPPDGVFLDESVPGGRVSMTYDPRPGLARDDRTDLGLLFVQFRGEVDREVLAKVLGPGATRTRVSVGDAPGLWIEGAPHVVYYRDAEGRAVEDSVRLAGNVLLWERGEVTYRIEADIPRREAIRIAESVR